MKETETVEKSLELIEQKEEVKSFGENAAKAEAFVEKLTIKNATDEATAIKALTRIKEEWKRGETIRKFFVDPLKEQVKKIDALFKPNLDRFANAETEIRRKLIGYQNDVAAKAEAAKQKVMKQVEEGKIGVEKAVQKIEKVKEPEKTVRTEEATVTYRDQKKVVIEDATKLPREYLVPDEVKIRKVALAGVEIPGVKVVIEKVPSVKSNF